jgi:hypothetical protein
MHETIDDISSASAQLTAETLGIIRGAASENGMAVDDAKLVHGSSRSGLAGFIPVRDLQAITAQQVAAGAQIGLALFAPAAAGDAAYAKPMRSGVYVLTNKLMPGSIEGVSQLIDQAGAVVASTPLHLIQKNQPSAVNEVSVTVGDVTVAVGWFYICFDWDDPPGTPGGMCHHVCYGWQ